MLKTPSLRRLSRRIRRLSLRLGAERAEHVVAGRMMRAKVAAENRRAARFGWIPGDAPEVVGRA